MHFAEGSERLDAGAMRPGEKKTFGAEAALAQRSNGVFERHWDTSFWLSSGVEGVVFRSACPSVCDTSVIGAPPSMAWLAWACRSQWAEVAG